MGGYRDRVDSKGSKEGVGVGVEVGISITSFWKFAVFAAIVNLVVLVLGIISLNGFVNFQSFADLAAENDVTFYNDLKGAVTSIIISAGCVMGVSAIMVGLRKVKNVAYVFITIMTLASAAQVYFGSDIVTSITRHEDTLCAARDCNPIVTSFDADQLGTLAMEQIAFNTCCFSRINEFNREQQIFHAGLGLPDPEMNETFVQKGPSLVCEEGPAGQLNESAVCPGDQQFLPEIVAQFVDVELLCACIPVDYAAKESSIEQEMQDKGICADLSEVRIKFDDSLDIPTTTNSIFTALGTGYESFPRFKDNIDDVALVGSNGVPIDSNQDDGFGCGLMFSKGFLWYTELYLEQTFKPAAFAAIASGAIGILFGLAQTIFVLLQYCGGDEEDDRFDDDDGDEFEHTKPVVAADAPPRPAPAAPVSRSGSGDKLSKEQVEEELVHFYSKYDPSKVVNGRIDKDVVEYALVAGIPALNKKLVLKYGYGIDLSRVQGRKASRLDQLAADFSIDDAL